MPLGERIASFWARIQGDLFPWLREELGVLLEVHERLIIVLEVVRIDSFIASYPGGPGRPLSDRVSLGASFVAKAVLGLAETRELIERLKLDKTLRRLVGYRRLEDIPSEATFSRAFEEFAVSGLAGRVHAVLVERMFKDHLICHVARDSTAIEAREKPERKPRTPEAPKRRRGRPRKGEAVAQKPQRRLERQLRQTVPEMLAELPKACDVSAKRNSKGHQTFWVGYKLHMDVAEGDIPLSCILTSASLHDSQAAIPLAHMTAKRVTHLYDLMDSAYRAGEIIETSRKLGHVPLIDPQHLPGNRSAAASEIKARRTLKEKLNLRYAEDRRFDERTTAERANAAIKDNYGARLFYLRGHAKIFCHLMFAVLALTAEKLMRLTL